ncbi:hypothetical protein [Saccharothrix syringae]|uniref:hypothetical protein n=1 Tax=Saccharothrix syringae TaxID=103733 RepID=UPI00068D809D|nr:hypothetical protein [Saccharothrix syringae]
MLCAAGRPLRLVPWLAVPFLFSGSVLGLTGLGDLLLGTAGSVTLSSPLFGAGVAVGVVSSGTVTWAAPWQRTWLRWPYLAAVMCLGIAVDGLPVPPAVSLPVGLPLLALLVTQYFRDRRRTAALAKAGLTTPPC